MNYVFLYKMAGLPRLPLAVIISLQVENMVDPFNHKKSARGESTDAAAPLGRWWVNLLAVYIEWLAPRVLDPGIWSSGSVIPWRSSQDA